ncbi:hypothetical protein PG993_003055 [Apiospora rasikravindrae]|uniref:BZIP domain-containing protein n=1 Tax=Apiospora rasikravindrae TaxID=990691 RepID=A0ABR1TYF5_9PEZI
MAGADRVAEWQQSITAIRDPEDHPDDPPLLAQLYGACSILFRDIMVDFAGNSSVDKSVLLSLQRSQSYLVLWADGYGRFTNTNQAYAQHSPRPLLISKLILAGLVQLVSQEHRTRLSTKITDITHAADKIKFLIEHDDTGDSDSDTSSVASSHAGDTDLEEIAEDLLTDTQCLMDLGSRFQEEHVGPVTVEPAASATQLITWEPSMNFVDRVRWRYPQCETGLAERLGKANWARVLRHRETVSENSRAELVVLSSTNKAAPSQTASTTFHDSALGSSVPSNIVASGNTATEYAETMVSYRAGRGDSVRVPPLPDGALEGKPFTCVGCGIMVTIKTKSAWKKHLFLDLKPYICLVDECAFDISPFPTKVQWEDHLLEHAPLGSSSSISECPICQDDSSNSQTTAKAHLARHLEEIALTVLPTNPDSEDGTDLDSGLASSETSTGDSQVSVGREHDTSHRPAVLTPGMHDGLSPLGPPQSNANGHASLPPIRSQLGEQLSDHPNMTEKEHAMRHGPPSSPRFPDMEPTVESYPNGEEFNAGLEVAGMYTPVLQGQSAIPPRKGNFAQQILAAGGKYLSRTVSKSSRSPFRQGSPLAPAFDGFAQSAMAMPSPAQQSAKNPSPFESSVSRLPVQTPELNTPGQSYGSLFPPRRRNDLFEQGPQATNGNHGEMKFTGKGSTDYVRPKQHAVSEHRNTIYQVTEDDLLRTQQKATDSTWELPAQSEQRNNGNSTTTSNKAAHPGPQLPPPMQSNDEFVLFENPRNSKYPPPPNEMTLPPYGTASPYAPITTAEGYSSYIDTTAPCTLPSMTHFSDAIKRESFFGKEPSYSSSNFGFSQTLRTGLTKENLVQPATYPDPYQLQHISPYQTNAGPVVQDAQSAFLPSANLEEDWTKVSDLAESRRIQNRIAQRNYRKKLKRRLEDLENRAGRSSGEPPKADNTKQSTHGTEAAGLGSANVAENGTPSGKSTDAEDLTHLPRPWKCPIPTCKYNAHGWPAEKELNRHVKDKHSSAPSMYECLYQPCPYKSKRESNCKQHMEKAHGWKPEVPEPTKS